MVRLMPLRARPRRIRPPARCSAAGRVGDHPAEHFEAGLGEPAGVTRDANAQIGVCLSAAQLLHARWRRHHLPQFRRRRRLSPHAGFLLGLPELDRDTQGGDREHAPALHPRGRGGARGLSGRAARSPACPSKSDPSGEFPTCNGDHLGSVAGSYSPIAAIRTRYSPKTAAWADR